MFRPNLFELPVEGDSNHSISSLANSDTHTNTPQVTDELCFGIDLSSKQKISEERARAATRGELSSRKHQRWDEMQL